jgi:hypothetical protein
MKPSGTAILADEVMYPDCIGMDLQVCSHSCYIYQIAITTPAILQSLQICRACKSAEPANLQSLQFGRACNSADICENIKNKTIIYSNNIIEKVKMTRRFLARSKKVKDNPFPPCRMKGQYDEDFR